MNALVAANRVREGITTTTSLGDCKDQRLIRDFEDKLIERQLDALKSKHDDDRCAAMAELWFCSRRGMSKRDERVC